MDREYLEEYDDFYVEKDSKKFFNNDALSLRSDIFDKKNVFDFIKDKELIHGTSASIK